jgi:glucosamine--fructose-6-phosphate aminotransferase (isomerizing)
MCGIVGYVGDREANNILLSGLKRLEYRGYDSSGIATLDNKGNVSLARKKGKVAELEGELSKNKNSNKIGIGHTRWATHGAPSEHNAHPHRSGDVYLVHNGIIENYKELKVELKGHKFTSETDTEVLAALIDSLYTDGVKLKDAVAQALKLVSGTYGIAVLSTREPETIVVARSGSPLIIGVGKGETFIASDATALIGHTDQAIYLNDGEMAVCTAGAVDLMTISSQPVSAKVETIASDIQKIQKNGYEHFLIKEIMEQPESLRSTLSGRLILDENRVQLGGLNMSLSELKEVENVVIVGCGTAYYAGLLASYYIEKIVGNITVDVVIASEFRYRSFYLPKNTVAVIVSQSGETADTLACMREIKSRGIRTLGIINAVGSTIAREVDGGVYVHAGPEISVASTKAFTSQASAMIMFGIQVAQAKGVSLEKTSEYVKELNILPKEIETVLKNHRNEIEELSKKYSKYDHALFLGRDTSFPVALEGALKLKEISYIHAEAYATGELKHGPIALIDNRFFEIMIMNDDWLIDKSSSGLSEVNARGGHVIVLTNSSKKFDCETTVRIKTKNKLLAPLVLNVLQQLFAYYVSVAKGNDVDQPRNLAKSVTVE